MKKSFGFTLAEVLITLGIIGVVAALTIPSLMNSTGQNEYKSGFKKAISVISQAGEKNFALDNADFADMNATTATSDPAVKSLFSLFSNRMNVESTFTSGTASIGVAASNYTIFFSDGMALSFDPSAANCSSTIAPCKALVDVNGLRKPNVVTSLPTALKDQYAIILLDRQALPNSDAARAVLYNK